MSKVSIGKVCAYIHKSAAMKAQYPQIGVAFREEGEERISIKIDTLPLPTAGWTGWVNIFPWNDKDKTVTAIKNMVGLAGNDFQDDDIPF